MVLWHEGEESSGGVDQYACYQFPIHIWSIVIATVTYLCCNDITVIRLYPVMYRTIQLLLDIVDRYVRTYIHMYIHAYKHTWFIQLPCLSDTLL